MFMGVCVPVYASCSSLKTSATSIAFQIYWCPSSHGSPQTYNDFPERNEERETRQRAKMM
jgi:hypothetical protein